MSSEAPRSIPLSQLTEYFMTQQRAHYDDLLAKAVRDIEALDTDDVQKRAAVETTRAMLAADLDRCEREVSALVARGMRTDEALH